MLRRVEKKKATIGAAVAAGLLIGANALKGERVNFKPVRQLPPIEQKTVFQKPEKPSGLTWREALQRIEEDTRQRAGNRARLQVAKGKPKYTFTERELTSFMNFHELDAMRDGEYFHTFAPHVSSLAILHAPLLNEINSKFQGALQKYLNGGETPWATRPFSEIRAEAEWEAERLTSGYSNPQRAFMYTMARSLVAQKINFAKAYLAGTTYEVKIDKKGHAVLIDKEPYRRTVRKTTMAEVREHWKNQRTEWPR